MNNAYFLHIKDEDGSKHLLPYAHLLHLTLNAERSGMEIFFATKKVVIKGPDLSDLLKQIQEQQDALQIADETKITSIVVFDRLQDE